MIFDRPAGQPARELEPPPWRSPEPLEGETLRAYVARVVRSWLDAKAGAR